VLAGEVGAADGA